jgi:hypothetical protein
MGLDLIGGTPLMSFFTLFTCRGSPPKPQKTMAILYTRGCNELSTMIRQTAVFISTIRAVDHGQLVLAGKA